MKNAKWQKKCLQDVLKCIVLLCIKNWNCHWTYRNTKENKNNQLSFDDILIIYVRNQYLDDLEQDIKCVHYQAMVYIHFRLLYTLEI